MSIASNAESMIVAAVIKKHYQVRLANDVISEETRRELTLVIEKCDSIISQASAGWY